MKQPVQDRSRESAERVLDAVLEILAADGLGALTTARVARESGVSNGSIYHRFGTRKALLLGALARFTERLHAQVRQLQVSVEPPPGLTAAVPLLVATYQGLFAEHGSLIRAFFVDSLSDPDLADAGETGKALFAGQVAEFLAPFAGEITAADPLRVAEMVHRLLFGYFMMRTLFHDGPGDEVMLLTLHHAVLGMLDPSPAPGGGTGS